MVMSLNDVLKKIETTLLQNPVQRIAAKVDWSRFLRAFPQLSRDSRFVEIMSNASRENMHRQKSSTFFRQFPVSQA